MSRGSRPKLGSVSVRPFFDMQNFKICDKPYRIQTWYV